MREQAARVPFIKTLFYPFRILLTGFIAWRTRYRGIHTRVFFFNFLFVINSGDRKIFVYLGQEFWIIGRKKIHR